MSFEEDRAPGRKGTGDPGDDLGPDNGLALAGRRGWDGMRPEMV